MRLPTTVLAIVALASLGANCTPGAPSITLTIHGVDDDLNDLLILPTDNLLLANATFSAGDDPVDPGSFTAEAYRWGGGERTLFPLWANASGALAIVGTSALPPGSWTLIARVRDVAGRSAATTLNFAVRHRQSPAPIGTGQNIWYDFESDRDAVPGPDFAVDLLTFGLGSPLEPVLSAQLEADVIEAVLARVEEAYHEEDPNGLGSPDPVDVAFFAADPGVGDVTQICVGGSDPSGSGTIGSILIDPSNSNRTSVECGTLPPTGVFPRELTVYQGQTSFQNTFGPLMPALGGTPAGEHPLDPIVLDPGFDPGSASAEELARFSDVTTAMQRFADALGSVLAHETGHALGLVPPGPPGSGLHGGQAGPEFSHDVTSSGTIPTPNYLMKQGGSFNFAKLTGIYGQTLPYFRALDHAYLRDRVMLDASVTQLLPPPTVTGVDPALVVGTLQVSITGSGFAATPSLQLVSPGYTYDLIGEVFVTESLVSGWVVSLQVPPGTYDLVVRNPDGQSATLPDAVEVAPY